MAVKRVFLDWSQPMLPALAQAVRALSRSQTLCDLSHLAVVFPGGQAGRRFLEVLTDQCGGALSPPRILTIGSLPELLYVPQRPFASNLTQRLAWGEALRRLPEEKLQHVVRPAPDRDDLAAWLPLGELLRRQHSELARDQLNFADVWKRGTKLSGFNEVERWQALSDVQAEYLRILDGFDLWDQQTARLKAIELRECRTDLEIVLAGTVDLNRTLRRMLEQAADRVTAYIHAPRNWQDRFDAAGGLIAEAWEDGTVELRPEQLQMVDDAEGQVAAVVRALEQLQGRYAVNDITIAVPEERLVPALQRTLAQFEAATFWPIDRSLSATGPARLLAAAAQYLRDRRTDSCAALLRHPHVGDWLRRQRLPEDWLTAWDGALQEHLPSQTDVLPAVLRPEEEVPRRLLQALQRLLAPLRGADRPLSAWDGPLREFLLRTYGASPLNLDDPEQREIAVASEKLAAAFREHAALPPALDAPVSAAEAIELTLREADQDLYHVRSAAAITLSGWLELPLDDAPVAIVTSFNEGLVPASVNHDLFLPNRLRAHLGIEDNARRYARDLYVLSVLAQTREQLQFIVPRRDVSGSPVPPSRLLFAADPEQVAQRVLSFYDGRQAAVLPLPAAHASGESSAFRVPRPVPRNSCPIMFRVTEFRDYLASPYQYYLGHVLGLENCSDEVGELDGAAFGTLVHGALEAFGNSDVRQTDDEREIIAFLDEALRREVVRRYGTEPLAAVRIQQEQARRRLQGFARWQAQWRQQGWEIWSAERERRNLVCPFALGDGRNILLKGRIDRIDYHPKKKEWAVFDYKTGDAGKGPDTVHRRGEEWTDLQLPLYRHLAREAGAGEDVKLGYIVLPRDVDRVTAEFAPWSEEELRAADEVARAAALCILSETFWTPGEIAGEGTPFDPICQAGVFGRENLR